MQSHLPAADIPLSTLNLGSISYTSWQLLYINLFSITYRLRRDIFLLHAFYITCCLTSDEGRLMMLRSNNSSTNLSTDLLPNRRASAGSQARESNQQPIPTKQNNKSYTHCLHTLQWAGSRAGAYELMGGILSLPFFCEVRRLGSSSDSFC